MEPARRAAAVAHFAGFGAFVLSVTYRQPLFSSVGLRKVTSVAPQLKDRPELVIFLALFGWLWRFAANKHPPTQVLLQCAETCQ